MEDNAPKKPRRVRYSGTHPKAFQEKYKELNPDIYSADIENIIRQGKTPAGMHRSICVDEIMAFFNIAPGESGLDATLGYGGHTLEMLKRVTLPGRLYAIDADPLELPKTKERLQQLGYAEDILSIRKMNFAEMDQLLYESGPLNFILADLGVSSMQIDNPERGFSYKVDGPLDLRLNPKSGKPASVLLQNLTQSELKDLLIENADEPYAPIIAKYIIAFLDSGQEIQTTTQLKSIIADALNFLDENTKKELIKKSCQRCFQALRIAVNNEFGVLNKFLEKLPKMLAPGGRVAILTFHSGEDRRVKKYFEQFYEDGIFQEITHEPVRPSAAECHTNPRAKSAKLRWAIRA